MGRSAHETARASSFFREGCVSSQSRARSGSTDAWSAHCTVSRMSASTVRRTSAADHHTPKLGIGRGASEAQSRVARRVQSTGGAPGTQSTGGAPRRIRSIPWTKPMAIPQAWGAAVIHGSRLNSFLKLLPQHSAQVRVGVRWCARKARAERGTYEVRTGLVSKFWMRRYELQRNVRDLPTRRIGWEAVVGRT